MTRPLKDRKARYYSDGGFYKGQFLGRKRHGHGTYTFPNGDRAVGMWKHGVLSGHARFEFNSDDYMEGEFKDGNLNGTGIQRHSGDVCIGEFEDDMCHGVCSKRFSNGDLYVGQYSHGDKHGTGTYTWADGDTYTGDWRDDVMEGYGVRQDMDGTIFRGMYKEGVRDGAGVLACETHTIRGEWAHGLLNGYTEIDWSFGDKYRGQYENGLRHGEGLYYYADGAVSAGTWFLGKREGEFLCTQDGKTFCQVWKDGEQESSEQVDFVPVRHLGAKKAYARVERKESCVVCYEQAPDVIFEPCGHWCACASCEAKLDKCPMCRVRIENVKQVY